MIKTRDITKVMRTLFPAPVLLQVRDISLPGYRAQWLVKLPDAAGTRLDSTWLGDYLKRRLGTDQPVVASFHCLRNRRGGGHWREYAVTIGTPAPEWRRELRDESQCDCHVPPMRHDMWRIDNPAGDGKNRLISDFAIKTYGRKHIEGLVERIGAPPLPEEAWKVLA